MREFPKRQVDALGIETSYYFAGPSTANPLVLLHGTSTSGDSFRELMHGLSESYFMVAPDIPGFGYSSETDPYTLDHLTEWLASFIDRLDLSSVTLLGPSFGGLLASAYAFSYPEDVSKLLLLAPALLVSKKVPPVARNVGTTRRVIEAGIGLSRMALERIIRIQFHEPDRMEESVWDRRRADYSRARASAAAIGAVAAADLTPRLPEIAMPTLVVWGRNDPILAPSQASQIKGFFASAQLQMLDNCGHVPMIEQRDEVVKISMEFIQ